MATFSEKVKLLRGLLTGETAYTGPFFALVDITRRCNLQCLGCRFHSSEMSTPQTDPQTLQDISFDLFKKLCHELKAMHTHALILIGDGEPLLHRRIFDMISTAKASGFHITLVTNGTLLNRGVIQSLFDSQLDAVQVSLWASSTKEYEMNYPGVPLDFFKKVVESVTLMNSLKQKYRLPRPCVILHHPLNRHNFQKLETFVELALRAKCDGVSFSPFYTWRGALSSSALSPSEEQSLLLSLGKIEERLQSLRLSHNIGQTRTRYQIGKRVWQNIPCYIGWIHARIKTDGTILPCNRCDIPMGNIGATGFQEIWNGSSYRNFRSQASTREGLASLSHRCDCEYCCFIKDNLRIHRFFKLASTFMRHPRKEGLC
jgi:radical SAM protein with 4Fe4S-binding SPASM domain